MREIEFKAKKVDDGEWVYGSYTAMMEDDRNECFRTKPHKIYHRIWQWESGDWNMGGYANYEVIPETVGQFTGLKDKNGVEIYEGDIFHLGDKNITYTVVWHDTGLRGKQNGTSSYVGLEHWKKHVEVIGNIHDKNKQKRSLVDTMRGDEKIVLYDDNPKNHENGNDANRLLAEVPEYLLCSAIWFDDGIDTYVHQPRNVKTGFVVCGRRHHNCFTTVAMLMGIRKERMTEEVQGFLTNKDRFVDRYEAAQIAIASGQIKEPKDRLFSEDVW